MQMKSELKSQIILEFLANHRVTRTKLLKRLWSRYKNAKELDDVLKQFEDAGNITFVHSLNLYVMPKSQRDEYIKFRKNT